MAHPTFRTLCSRVIIFFTFLCLASFVTGDFLHSKVLDPVAYAHGHSQWFAKTDINEGSTHTEEGVDPPTVSLGQASIEGKFLNTFLGRQFRAFQGIPFADKPDRFEYPVLKDSATWPRGTYDATYFRARCPQHSLIAPVISGDEDCLHINVYSPVVNSTDLPVMVFIHGGAYMSGEAGLYIPTKLMDKDVVVAVIQYRLGSLGFLYSGTRDAPGNMGLMDQVTALRWVNKYIMNFGGDPGSVTVFGQSAGGASTSWMQITPLTRAENNDELDLAHSFIPMSGSALEYWTLDPNWQQGFHKQVEATGCNTTLSPKEMVECMKNLTMDEVVWASLKVYHQDRYDGNLGFTGQVPVIQDTEELLNSGLELVITEHPIESIRGGRFLQVPTMTGAVREEGSLVIGLLYKDYMVPRNLTDDIDFLRDDLFPTVAQAFGISDNTNSVPNSFRLGFMPDDVEMGNWDQMVGGLIDLTGMMFLKSGMWTLAHEINAYNPSVPVFVYSFEFESNDSLFYWIFLGHEDMAVPGGITHADDLLYLFNMPSYCDEREASMVNKMTTLYTNLAKYGDPTPAEVEHEPGQWKDMTEKWLPYEPESKPFLLLKTNLTLEYDFATRWNYNKYGYPHVEPSKTNSASSDTRQISEPEYEQAVNEAEQYKLATIITGSLCACAMLALVAVVGERTWKKKKIGAREEAARDNVAMVDIN